MKPLDLTADNLPYVLTPEQTALWETLSAEFDRLNAAHFEERLTRPEIVVSTRKTYGGYYQPSRHRIVVSWQAYEEHGLPEALNTFRHEVAHIVHPNHSAAFWNLASALGVNRRYASPPKVRPAPRYIYACPVCDRRYERRRRIKTASCASCDSRYNPRFALRLVSTEGQ
jgi:predicted SprT family Zn-dependent metalloprotease